MLEMVIRLVLGTGIVVGALLAWRWAMSRGMTARGGPALRVVGRTGLTKNTLVAVVAVGERRFLVGASDQGVRMLSELAADDVSGDEQVGDDLDAQPDDGLDGRVDDALDVPDDLSALFDGDAAAIEAMTPTDLSAHGSGRSTSGPRIGPLDRLREMTVRSHLREPIRVHPRLRR